MNKISELAGKALSGKDGGSYAEGALLEASDIFVCVDGVAASAEIKSWFRLNFEEIAKEQKVKADRLAEGAEKIQKLSQWLPTQARLQIFEPYFQEMFAEYWDEVRKAPEGSHKRLEQRFKLKVRFEVLRSYFVFLAAR